MHIDNLCKRTPMQPTTLTRRAKTLRAAACINPHHYRIRDGDHDTVAAKVRAALRVFVHVPAFCGLRAVLDTALPLDALLARLKQCMTRLPEIKYFF